MSLRYLPEHLENARLALDLATKEVAHLAYTHRTLFGRTIDLDWVKCLERREDLSEKVDAFVSRFGRLQDHIGEKLIPRFAALLGEDELSNNTVTIKDMTEGTQESVAVDKTAEWIAERLPT